MQPKNDAASKMERFLETFFPIKKDNIHWYGLTGVSKVGTAKNVEIELFSKTSFLSGFSYVGFKVSIVHLEYGFVHAKTFFFDDYFEEGKAQRSVYYLVTDIGNISWHETKPSDEQYLYLEEQMWKYIKEWE